MTLNGPTDDESLCLAVCGNKRPVTSSDAEKDC